MTPEELQAEQRAQAQATAAGSIGMIPALQLPPNHRDDRKQEMFAYNRLVKGLPQRQIEQELVARSKQQKDCLLGKVAMTLGMELRRAYVNDLAVLSTESAPVTCLAVLSGANDDNNNSAILAVGDSAGGLRLWRLQYNQDSGEIDCHQEG